MNSSPTRPFIWFAAAFAPWLGGTGVLAFLFVSASPAWLLLGPVLFYGVVPMLDVLVGNARSDGHAVDLRAAANHRGFDFALYLGALNVVLVFALIVWFVGTHDIVWWAWLALTTTLGVVLGFALTLSHELGHKHFWFKRKLALFIASLSGYGHFSIEHNEGHHTHVATFEDSASARMGESIWSFVLREAPGAWKRAWRLERARLREQGLESMHWRNQIVQGLAITFFLYGAIALVFGPSILPFLALVALKGGFQLTSANYVEHYGLLRTAVDGVTERCAPRHSWNSNHLISNLLLFHLQRHSDHHTYPARPYQALRSYRDVPTLPYGYFTMFVIAYVPPLWFRVMDPRVVRETGATAENINFTPEHKKRLCAKYALQHA